MISRVRKRITRLEIQMTDIIIGLSIANYVENMVLSMHPKNLKIAIVHGVVYEQSMRPVDSSIYKNTLEGWLANWIIEPIARLHKTYCLRDRIHPQLQWWIRYRKSLLEIYDKVVVLGNFSTQFVDDVITMTFPYVLTLENGESSQLSKEPQKVVFFGTNFMGFVASQIEPNTYARNVNACL